MPKVLIEKFGVEDIITVSTGEDETPGQGGDWD